MRTPKTVLVTGSSGFIGHPVAQALAADGAEVIGLDLTAPDIPAFDYELIKADFTEPHALYRIIQARSVDTVVHTGGISGPMLARDDPYIICKANVIGTINLLEASRVSRIERFVFCGSASAYGDTPPAPVPDDAPLRATDVYSSSKGAGDLLLRAYRVQHGLDAVSLRISNGYGPRRRTRCAVRAMIENALDGKATHMTWGKGYGRVYLYVADAVSAVVAAVKANHFGQWSYNIAGRDFMMMEDIAAVVARVIPGAVITMQEGGDELGYRREALDITAARRDLGWEPEFTIERGITAYTDWIRAERRRPHDVTSSTS